MGLIARLFRTRPRMTNALRRRIPTASQRDMDRLLELTWRQRVRRREEARAAAVLLARPVLDEVPFLRRQAL